MNIQHRALQVERTLIGRCERITDPRMERQRPCVRANGDPESPEGLGDRRARLQYGYPQRARTDAIGGRRPGVTRP